MAVKSTIRSDTRRDDEEDEDEEEQTREGERRKAVAKLLNLCPAILPPAIAFPQKTTYSVFTYYIAQISCERGPFLYVFAKASLA